MKYSTTQKTIHQVIQDTKAILKKYEVKPEGKLFYLKKYQDCTSILTDNKVYYVSCLNDIYGPFKDTKKCTDLRRIIFTNTNAHQQAMVNSW